MDDATLIAVLVVGLALVYAGGVDSLLSAIVFGPPTPVTADPSVPVGFDFNAAVSALVSPAMPSGARTIEHGRPFRCVSIQGPTAS